FPVDDRRLVDDPEPSRILRTTLQPKEGSFDALPRLRFAPVEVGRIASYFPDATVLGGSAAVQEIASRAKDGRLGRYDVVHIAGHTVFNASTELCGLVIGSEGPSSDYDHLRLVSVEDVLLDWNLHARLVTLSACQSVRNNADTRGEEVGFTPALFSAGASNVLVSMWPVGDGATTILMCRFYQNLTATTANGRFQGVGPVRIAQALREAKLYLRDYREPSGAQPYAHPAYWGGFILMGLPEAR